MLRSIRSADTLAGLIAVAQPSFADPIAKMVSDPVQAAVGPTQEPASPHASSQRSLETQAPAGFGWD
jgi:hypothetical protein